MPVIDDFCDTESRNSQLTLRKCGDNGIWIRPLFLPLPKAMDYSYEVKNQNK